MSYFRVCKNTAKETPLKIYPFDNKEDAEHFAKNESVADDKHSYEIQENDEGEFSTIKEYYKGEVVL
ncbi:MAG: hypothetical protein V4501_02740 [Pseudomonadota bacterium]